MTRDKEIKLKVATITPILIASIAIALYLNNSPPEPLPNAPRDKITFPPAESVTARALIVIWQKMTKVKIYELATNCDQLDRLKHSSTLLRVCTDS